jgi:hypothetical protein
MVKIKKMEPFWYLLIKDLYLIHLNSRKNTLNRSMFLIKCEPLMRDGGICINSKGNNIMSHMPITTQKPNDFI